MKGPICYQNRSINHHCPVFGALTVCVHVQINGMKLLREATSTVKIANADSTLRAYSYAEINS